LLTHNISTQIEALDGTSEAVPGDSWEIWVRDEDRLELARAELQSFRQNPHDTKYQESVTKAKRILEEQVKKRQQAARNVKRIESTRRPTALGATGPTPPLTITLLVLCIAISLISSFGTPQPTNEWGREIVEQLSFVSLKDYMESDNDPAASIKQGEIWRAITPIFLHLSPIHLAMNMFVLYSFGKLVERWIGTPRFALFVLLLSIGPNLLQGLSPEWMRGSPMFGGISGVLYGLFGYVWIRSTLNPNLGISIPMPIVVIFVGMIVVGLSGVVNWHYADLCHLGGLLIGSAMAFASEQVNYKT
jgi:GlpG protein